MMIRCLLALSLFVVACGDIEPGTEGQESLVSELTEVAEGEGHDECNPNRTYYVRGKVNFLGICNVRDGAHQNAKEHCAEYCENAIDKSREDCGSLFPHQRDVIKNDLTVRSSGGGFSRYNPKKSKYSEEGYCYGIYLCDCTQASDDTAE